MRSADSRCVAVLCALLPCASCSNSAFSGPINTIWKTCPGILRTTDSHRGPSSRATLRGALSAILIGIARNDRCPSPC
jgi:hypothetical protein